MTFEKFHLLREAKTICEGLDLTEEEFGTEFPEFPYAANEIAQVTSLPIFEDGVSKAKSILNFIMGKGSQIKSLGGQLQQALIAKTTTPYIAKDRIKAAKLDKDHAQTLRDNATAKVKEYGELVDRIKDKMDDIADDDTRLVKIASIVKNTASIKASDAKLKFLDNEDQKAIAHEKAKKKKAQDRIQDETKELNAEINHQKEKATEKPKQTPSSASSPKTGSGPAHVDTSALDKTAETLKTQIAALKKQKADYKDSNAYSDQHTKQAMQEKVAAIDDKLDELEGDLIENKLTKYQHTQDHEKLAEWKEKEKAFDLRIEQRHANEAKHKKEVEDRSREIWMRGKSEAEKKKLAKK